MVGKCCTAVMQHRENGAVKSHQYKVMVSSRWACKALYTARAEAALGPPFSITTFTDPFQKRLLHALGVQNFHLVVPMHFMTCEQLTQGAADWFSE